MFIISMPQSKTLFPLGTLGMIEYMEMLAVFESSSRSMLPERFKELEPETIQEMLDLMRSRLAGRL